MKTADEISNRSIPIRWVGLSNLNSLNDFLTGFQGSHMKKLRFLSAVILILFSLTVTSSAASAQPAKTAGNIYTKWIKLALVGKNQAEIEYYFRNIQNSSILQVKQRIRFAILENLRRAGIGRLITESSDADDLNVIIRKIIIEIRYAGMELDSDLRLTIKEEFGVELERL